MIPPWVRYYSLFWEMILSLIAHPLQETGQDNKGEGAHVIH
jgi:hypothetical protein